MERLRRLVDRVHHDKKLGLFLGTTAVVILLGSLLRLVDLEAKTVHHDESIHTYYSWLLHKDGQYQYHPLSHGPLLYYLISLSYSIFGVTDAAARFFPALFGIVLMISVLWWRREFSRKTTLLLLAIVATSPLLVYVSRFARHDMISLACTGLVLIATVAWFRKPQTWQIYLFVLALAVSYSNHELTYLTVLAWGISVGLIFVTGPEELRKKARVFFRNKRYDIILSVLISLIFITLFYSSFGDFPQGAVRALPNPFDPNSALGYWIEQHGVKRGNQPPYFYFLLLGLYELLTVLIGAVGIAVGIKQKARPTWRFVSIFATVTIIVYSVAGEKMPWLTVHSLLPIILSAGYLVDHLEKNIRPKVAVTLWTTVGIYLCFTLFSSHRLSFVHPTDPSELAVYVQTQPIVKDLRNIFAKEGSQLDLSIGTDLTWPMVWYYRDLPYRLISVIDRSSIASRWALLSEAEASKSEAHLRYRTSQEYFFRSWWVPKAGWPGFENLLLYYFLREPWNDLGGYRFYFFFDRIER